MSIFNVINLDIVDSTNTFLKQNYKKYNDLTICFANMQTNGHGRENRNWFSTKGESILFSILIKNKEIINRFYKLSLLSAKVIRDFLLKYIENIQIKWPNDVYVDGKKICGILLESVSSNEGIECLVLGVGININNTNFDNSIKNKATSLKLAVNKKFEIEGLKEELLDYLSKMIEEAKTDNLAFLEQVRKCNFLLDKTVYFTKDNVSKEVKVIDINDDCTLKVYDGKNYFSVYTGEVNLI